MSGPRTIPEIRARLKVLAEDLRRDRLPAARRREIAGEVTALAEETKRRSPARRGRTTARRVTDELADKVRAYADANPTINNRTIGQTFGIDGGRVSEILAGKRGEA